ncbi:unnamed protein product [Ostreobium quekettii]|uniref:Putative rRNA methyltransferase n=1 Tax=Ostreobium quekettii TaxID=121088 RepID=A0A8S1JG96_9CHLO|nr:unnamed protein product [Ostreobium quekettii]
MARRKAKGKHRLDKFYHLAKEQGYRSRAAFKLIQLNRKYQFLSNCRAVLDLCAAPGGWLQVVSKQLPVSSLVLGVDLAPIRPIRGVKTFVGDITTEKCRHTIKKEAAGGRFDVVLHDGSPNVGGAWTSEALSQAVLVLESLKLATEFLAPKGWFVTKVFRSNDYNPLLYACRQLFQKVEATKPTASRHSSAEIFVVCQGYKAPGKIDPRLLDPKHLFQDFTEVPKVGASGNLFQLTQQTRHRGGYEDGVSTTFKRVSVLAFIHSQAPIELLGQCTQFALEGQGADVGFVPRGDGDLESMLDVVRMHPKTTQEIRSLCADLKVLGRKDFKALLKWQMDMKKALAIGKDKEEAPAKGKPEEREEEDPENQLLMEMAKIKERMEARTKKEKKRLRKDKKASKIKMAKMAEAAEGAVELPEEGDLFTLDVLKSRKHIDLVNDAAPLSTKDLDMLDESSDEGQAESEGDEDGYDSEEDRLRYETLMEEYLDGSYKRFMDRRGIKDTAKRPSKRRRLGADGELVNDSSGSSQDEVRYERLLQSAPEPASEPPIDGGGLVVATLDGVQAGRPKSARAVSAQWFSQELFQNEDLMDDDEEADDEGAEDGEKEEEGEEEDGDVEEYQAAGRRMGTVLEQLGNEVPRVDAVGGVATVPSGEEELVEDGEGEATDQESDNDSDYGDPARRAAAGKRPDETDGFEVVHEPDSQSSGSDIDDEFRALDEEGKAEVLAMAKKFLKRSDKERIIEAAYNRYNFHDTDLPKWFVDDEKRNMRPVRHVSRQEIEEQKEIVRALDARPIKRVAEAKARKRKRLVNRLNAARKKAEAVMGQEDISAGSRMRQVQKLLAKARASEYSKKKKKKPGRSDRHKQQGKRLDYRMKADKRQRGAGRNGKNTKKIMLKRASDAALRKQRGKGKRKR